MDETYGTYPDDECFDIHDYDDDTDHDTDDETDDDTDDDTNDDTDDDTDDGGRGSRRRSWWPASEISMHARLDGRACQRNLHARALAWEFPRQSTCSAWRLEGIFRDTKHSFALTRQRPLTGSAD